MLALWSLQRAYIGLSGQDFGYSIGLTVLELSLGFEAVRFAVTA